jgi:heme/copper-type cytochrome/quinol oxidase subunit 2
MNAILMSAAEGEHEAFVTLPFPSVYFGVIAMGVFILMGLITWSYRDVANRHEHKVDDSKSHH